MLRHEALPVARMPGWRAEGLRESRDPTAESHPGRGDVPRGTAPSGQRIGEKCRDEAAGECFHLRRGRGC